jgi:hypothetical protein
LCYEQSLTGRRPAIVTFSAIQLPLINLNLEKVIAALDQASPGSFEAVVCGTFRRQKRD